MNNEIVVELLESVGDIYFGMDRSQVRQILGEYKEFKKSRFSKNTTDDFGICHVHYDSNNKCIAIELFDGITVKINEKVIIPNNFDEVCDILMDIDRNLEIEIDGCTSIDYSIGVYAPNKKIESILFGKKGYYNI